MKLRTYASEFFVPLFCAKQAEAAPYSHCVHFILVTCQNSNDPWNRAAYTEHWGSLTLSGLTSMGPYGGGREKPHWGLLAGAWLDVCEVVYVITEGLPLNSVCCGGEKKNVKGTANAEASTEVTEVGFYGGQGSMVLKSVHQSLSISAWL